MAEGPNAGGEPRGKTPNHARQLLFIKVTPVGEVRRAQHHVCNARPTFRFAPPPKPCVCQPLETLSALQEGQSKLVL